MRSGRGPPWHRAARCACGVRRTCESRADRARRVRADMESGLAISSFGISVGLRRALTKRCGEGKMGKWDFSAARSARRTHARRRRENFQFHGPKCRFSSLFSRTIKHHLGASSRCLARTRLCVRRELRAPVSGIVLSCIHSTRDMHAAPFPLQQRDAPATPPHIDWC